MLERPGAMQGAATWFDARCNCSRCMTCCGMGRKGMPCQPTVQSVLVACVSKV